MRRYMSFSSLAYFLGFLLILSSIVLMIIYSTNSDEAVYYVGLGLFIGGISWIFLIYGIMSMYCPMVEVSEKLKNNNMKKMRCNVNMMSNNNMRMRRMRDDDLSIMNREEQ